MSSGLSAASTPPTQSQGPSVEQAKEKTNDESLAGCHNTSSDDCPCEDDSSTSSTGKDGGCDGQDETPETSSKSKAGSIIDRAGFSHWHIAMDWKVEPAGIGGCGPCGGGVIKEADLPALQIRRVHRYREEFLYWSSLGPGVFLDWDQVIQFYGGGSNGITAIYYDPENTRHEVYKEKVNYRGDSSVDGVLWNRHLNLTGAMRLYEDSNWSVPTSDLNDLTTVTIAGHDGSMAYFEVFDVCPYDPNNTQFNLTKAARLARFEDRNGNGIDITHVHPVTTPRADCRDYWLIDTVTDAYNRTASFSYLATEVGGRRVIERIDMPDGTHIDYHYNAQYLTGVTLGNGETVTITKSYDPSTQCATVVYDDPASRGTHRRKEAHMSTMAWTNPEDANDVRNQAPDRLRLLINGEDEVGYLAWDNGATAEAFCYEGGSGLKRLRWEPFADFDGRPKAAQVATSWDITADESTYVWETRSSYNTAVDPVRVTKRTDNLGREWIYGWDKLRQKVTSTTYPDQSQASWTYNDFRQVVTYTDRLGRVTHYQYDSQGNLLFRTEAYGTSQAATEGFTYRAGTNQLESHTDFNGNTTDYVYDANNFLAEVREPKDHPADAVRPTTYYSYDAAGRLQSVTDPEGRVTRYESSPGVPGYDGRNRLTHVTYHDGSQEVFTYGTGVTANLLVSQIDRNGVETRYGYDDHGRVVDTIIAYGTAEEITSSCTYLDGTNLKDSKTDRGETTSFVYDYDNRLVATTRQANLNTSLTTVQLFDETKRQIGQIDAYGRYTYYVFDINDNVTRTIMESYAGSVADTLGLVDTLPSQLELANLARDLSVNAGYVIYDVVFDAESQAVRRIDGRGIVERIDYDLRGREFDMFQAFATVPAAATTAQLAVLDELDPAYVYSHIVDSHVLARTTYQYDNQDNITLVLHPRFYGGHFDNGSFGSLAGSQTKMEYTGRNHLAKRIVAYQDGDEAEESFTYYKDGTLRTHTDFNNEVWVTHNHACCGRLQAHTDPDGSMRISNTDFKGQITHTAVVSNGLTTPSDDAPADIQNPPYPWHDPVNADTVNETTSRFDGRGRVTHTTRWYAALGSVNDHGRANLPSPNNVPVPIAGENGVPAGDGLTTRYEYDDDLSDVVGLSAAYADYFALLNLGAGSDGYATAVTNPAGETSVTAYDGLGRVVMMIDAQGNATQTIYDQEVVNTAGDTVLQVTRIVDPDRSGYTGLKLSSHVQTDGIGRELATIDELGQSMVASYDASRNRISIRDALGIGQDCIFDERDRRIICVDTYGDAQFTLYDVEDRVVQIVDREGVDDLGGGTQAVYDTHSPFVQGLLGVSTFLYDARGRKTSAVDRIQGLTIFTYDDNNNLLTIEDADSTAGDGITRYAYSNRNLLTREELPTHAANTDPGEPGNDVKTYSYDAAQRLTTRTDQNGDQVTYIYDFIDRLSTRIYPDGKNDSFAYDDANRMTMALCERYGVECQQTYYPDSTMASESMVIDGQTYTISFDYDAANRQTNAVLPADPNNGSDDQDLERFFTARKQLQKIRFDGQWLAGSASSDGFEYAANRRETDRHLANGLSTSFNYRQSGSQLDNQVDSIRSSKSGTTVSHFSYVYDHNKRKEDEVDLVNGDYSQHFDYDAGDRVVKWTRSGASGALPKTQDWTLSKVGDWSQTIYDKNLSSERVDDQTHSAAHEVETTSLAQLPGQNAYRHDAKGNMTFNARRGQTYDYDYDNRIHRIHNDSLADPLQRLEARWVFDGSTVDIAGDHDGSISGGSLPVSDGRHGSGALRFTGSSGHRVLIPDSTDINTGIHAKRTVMLWFKLDTGAKNGSGKQVLYEEGGGSRGFNIYISGGQLYVGGWNNVGSESGWSGTYHSTTAFSENVWHHVAFVLDATAVIHPTGFKAYLDGQLFGAGPGSQLWAHGDDTGIGGLAGGSKWHDGTSSSGVRSVDGWIDECALYNAALGPAAIYLAAERAVLAYDLDAASGSTVVNQAVSTGSSLNASLQNGAQISEVAGHRQAGLDSTAASNSRLLVPNSSFINLQTHGKRTVALSFKLEPGALAASSGSPGNYQVLFEEGGGTRGLNIYLADNRLYIGGWNKPSGESNWAGSFISTDQLGENRWHHVALTLDGGVSTQADALTAYLDGEVIGTAAGSQLWAHSGNITFGAAGGGTIFHDGSATGVSLDGSIDNILMSNDVLAQDTIRDLAGTSSYRYDAFGRRVAKRVGASQRIFLCSASQVFSEYVDGEFDRSYVYGKYVDEPLAMITSTGDRYYYTRNNQFSVAALTDGSANVVERYAYDSYGSQVVLNPDGTFKSDQSGLQPYGYTGRRYEDETGLWYYRARYFDSLSGRFTARDSMGYLGLQYSLYSYVNNSPTIYLDPTGNCLEGSVDQSFKLNIPDYLYELFNAGKKKPKQKRKKLNRKRPDDGLGADAGDKAPEVGAGFAIFYKQYFGCCEETDECMLKLKTEGGGTLSAGISTIDLKFRPVPSIPALAVKISGSLSVEGSAVGKYDFCKDEGDGGVKGSIKADLTAAVGADIIVASIYVFGKLEFSVNIESYEGKCDGKKCDGYYQPSLSGTIGLEATFEILWWEYKVSGEIWKAEGKGDKNDINLW